MILLNATDISKSYTVNPLLTNLSYAINEGDKNIAFIDGATLFEGEMADSCTVDTCHPNDLGFYRMSQKIGAVVKEMLK